MVEVFSGYGGGLLSGVSLKNETGSGIAPPPAV